MLPFIVAADVVQGGERLSAIRGPAIETKGRWLERTAAGVLVLTACGTHIPTVQEFERINWKTL